MKKHLLILSIIFVVFAACKKESELKKSVFMEDPDNEGLPAYSEWGYNTFGAYYDREIFVSNNEVVPSKVIVSNSTMSFILDGQQGIPDEYYYHYYYKSNFKSYYTAMSMTFKLSNFLPSDYSNLAIFNDTTLDLTNPSNQVTVSIDTNKYTANILSGTLTFKRAQNLKVDKQPIEVILSGYFEFKAIINNKPVTISEGRFDVGIGPDNFYKY